MRVVNQPTLGESHAIILQSRSSSISVLMWVLGSRYATATFTLSACSAEGVRIQGFQATCTIVSKSTFPREACYFSSVENVVEQMYPLICSPLAVFTRKVIVFLVIAIPFCTILLLLQDFSPRLHSRPPPRISHWHGFAKVEKLFILYALKQ